MKKRIMVIRNSNNEEAKIDMDSVSALSMQILCTSCARENECFNIVEYKEVEV